MTTLASLFEQSAIQFKDKACISIHKPGLPHTAAQSLSFAQFHAALGHKARQLQGQHHLQSGDTIALLADNSIAYLVLTFGATLAGIRVLLLSTRALPEHLQHFLQSTNCRLVFTSPAHASLARAAGFPVAALDDGVEIPAEAPAPLQPTPNADDCALIMHTSGTTSMPRLIHLSHRNILSNQQAVQASVGAHWTGADSSLLFLPLFHGYTLLSQFLRNVSIGASTVLLQHDESLSAENLIAALDKTGVSFFCCVPWMLRLLHDLVLHEQKAGESHALGVLRSLNFIITAGAPLDRSTGDFFTSLGVRLVSVFGLTEAAGFVLHSSFEDNRWDLLNPVADAGIGFEPVAAGSSEQELVLTASPMVALDMDSRATAARLTYRTSDVFCRMDGGWAYIGRNDQMYNGPHGEKINPLAFETALAELPEVHKVFVNGEDLLFNCALVELRPEFVESSAARASILAAVQSRINPALEMPARVYPNDVSILGPGVHLPLTAKGTVDRKAAKAMLRELSGAAVPQAPPRATVDLASLVQRHVRAYLQLPPNSSVDEDAGLLELGFDSLMTLSLRNALQRDLDIAIPLDLMLGFPTLAELVATLESHRRAAPVHAGTPAQAPEDGATNAAAWRRIPLEQAIFHTAHYTFPFPTYNVSISLLAPRRLSLAEVEAGMRYLEQRHEVLRSIYTPDGLYTIAPRSFVNEALLGQRALKGSHDIYANPAAQALIGEYLNCAFDLGKGPVYRFALIDITDATGATRTLVYVGLNHICGDFRGFNALASELMELLDHGTGAAPPAGDGYAARVPEPAAADLRTYVDDWRRLMTVMPTLKEGHHFRAGHRQYFRFDDVNLERVARILRRHNISLYNGVYAIYAVALARHLADQSLQDFHTATAVTSRITPAIEDLMGCFIHSPMLRFHLDASLSMLQMMTTVQQATRTAFTAMITNPAAYLRAITEDPSNLVPFISRNVFLYRSPEEITTPLPGWATYRNEFFFENCDVGMYLDFCANRRSHVMEGYVLINLHYCEPGVIQPILDDIRTLLLEVLANPGLDFPPLACVAMQTT